MPNQSVGILVEASLPRMIGMSEIGLGFQDICEDLVEGELFSVVIGVGQNLVQIGFERFDDGG